MLSFYEIAFFGGCRTCPFREWRFLRVGGVEMEIISVGCARLVVTGLCFFVDSVGLASFF